MNSPVSYYRNMTIVWAIVAGIHFITAIATSSPTNFFFGIVFAVIAVQYHRVYEENKKYFG